MECLTNFTPNRVGAY